MTNDEYLSFAKHIWKNYVPQSGQANTIQGELLRSVEKLRDEAQRNGNINFNENCHEILIQFLRVHLLDESIFNDAKLKQIVIDLERLTEKDNPYLNDDLYDRLAYRVVDWVRAYSNVDITHNFNSKLKC